MNKEKLAKYLKVAIWITLGLIVIIPIYIDSDFFFPYIFSKALAFRVLTEALLLLWLCYLWSDKEKKFKLDWLTIILLAMIFFMFIAGIFGVDFYRSFWSIMERSEGILLWLHMLVFFLVVKNFVVRDKQKLWLLDIFLLGAQVVAVIGLFQFLGVEFINKTGVTDGRIQSTIGNAAYLAGYMLFAAFFALYLFVKRQNIWLRVYYLIAAIFDLFIMFNTGTRGALIAFIAAVLIFVVYNIFRLANKKLKLYFVILSILFVASLFLVYQNKNSAFIQNSEPLRRLTSISLEERTAQTRLMAWQAAWQGFQDSPVLGYGAENYYVVFNKYFNPKIYAHAGSRVWFDRAHNIFLDHLINGGIIELLLYLAFLALPSWILLRKGVLAKAENNDRPANWDKQILLLAIIAFVVQGMVVFEAMVTYLPLFIILAFVTNRYFEPIKKIGNKKIFATLFFVYLIVLIPIMYRVNIKEARANQELISALRLERTDIGASYNTYVDAIEKKSSGSNEFFRRLTEFVDGLVVNQAVQPYQALTYVEKVDSYLSERAETHPWDVANYILYMRHLNYTYPLDPNRLYKVESLAKEALKYSPTRPHIYYEVGYADVYIYQWLRDANQTDNLDEYQRGVVSNFQKAIDLNPRVEESYVNIIMSLLATDQPDKVESYLMTMDGMGLNYKTEDSLIRMANSAVSASYFDWAAHFFDILVKRYPENPDYYTSLALSYAYMGENEKAIAVAEEVKEFGEPYVTQADSFIADIKSGKLQAQP